MNIKVNIIWLMIAISSNAGAHVLLKLGMSVDQDKIAGITAIGFVVRSPFAWFGAAAFGVSLIFYSLAITAMRVSSAYPILVGGSFAIVILASQFIFRERIGWISLIGFISIAAGIYLLLFDERLPR